VVSVQLCQLRSTLVKIVVILSSHDCGCPQEQEGLLCLVVKVSLLNLSSNKEVLVCKHQVWLTDTLMVVEAAVSVIQQVEWPESGSEA
jgi:hypothetical protein